MLPIIARGVAVGARALARGAKVPKAPPVAAGSASTANTTNGIRNAEARFSEHARSRGTQARFERNFRKQKSSRRSDNDGADADESEFAPQEYARNENTNLGGQGMRQKNKGSPNRSLIPKRFRRITPFAKWVGIAVVVKSYIWQCLFGLLSLMSLVTHAMIEDFQNNNKLGIAISWFVDFSNFFPGFEVGFVFWGISIAIVIVTFLGFYLWFKALGLAPFGTVMSMFLSILFLALSLLPVTNLFPWLVLWFLYINSSSLFSKA